MLELCKRLKARLTAFQPTAPTSTSVGGTQGTTPLSLCLSVSLIPLLSLFLSLFFLMLCTCCFLFLFYVGEVAIPAIATIEVVPEGYAIIYKVSIYQSVRHVRICFF